jgi:maltodextrin utilization protein YvdJ
MTLYMNIASLVLLALAAVSYAGRRFHMLAGAAVLFFLVTGAATMMTWWSVSPALTVIILAVTLGLSLAALSLFAIDVVWAPFCAEMTYLMVLCWVLCPLAVVLNFLGLTLRALFPAATP